MSVYDALAPFYDALNDDVDYVAIESGVLTLAERYAERELCDAVELGCGTGSFTERLAARGFSVTGIDVSDAMLAEARAKKTLARATLIRADARDPLGESVADLVVSTQDTVSHLVGQRDLYRCFSSVAAALRPGGVFVFDVNTPYRVREVYGSNAFILEEKDVVCVWQNEYRARDCTALFRVSAFRDRGDGLWERSDGETRERGRSERAIRSALSRAGLEPVFYGSAWDLGPVTGTTERAAVAAVKRKSQSEASDV